MTPPPRLKFYVREDRDQLSPTIEGLNDIICFAEALELLERYGLSLTFSDETISWTCTDPDGVFTVTNNTAAGAIILWDIQREKLYGDDNRHKVRLVRGDPEG